MQGEITPTAFIVLMADGREWHGTALNPDHAAMRAFRALACQTHSVRRA